MAEGSVSAEGGTFWKLDDRHKDNVQGLVVSGFSDQTSARALFLRFPDSSKAFGGAWLTALRDPRLRPAGHTDSVVTDSDDADERCTALAFTFGGLRKMGLGASVLESFDRPFKEGMFQEDRLRRLGDKRKGKWQHTVIPAKGKDANEYTMPDLWSGNVHMEPKPVEPARAFQVAPKPELEAVPDAQALARLDTPTTVDALLLLYEKTDTALDDWSRAIKDTLEASGIAIVRTIDLRLNPDENGVSREHFGFADGLSQPLPYEPGVVKLRDGRDAPATDSLHRVPLGEILIGHPNAHGEIAEGPVIDKTVAGADILDDSPRAEGFGDFGLDGSYLVVRELRQDVAAFWKSMRDAAKSLNEVCPAAPVDAYWVADRVVGRNREGDMLSAKGPLPRAGKLPDNEFRFYDRDRDGLGCPLGSHVRRANPRDGLSPSPEFKSTLLAAANSHRILRRGRKFGPDLAPDAPDDEAERGLLFMCLNTDISRQFEFIQQTWILNPNFSRLYDEKDPLVGPRGPMTIPDPALRRRFKVETFVQMAGGEYFFLPSVKALKFLETL